MATKIFTPGTVIDSPWLNDVNFATYALLGDGTNPAPSKAAARVNLGVGLIANGGTGAVTAPAAFTNLSAGVTLSFRNKLINATGLINQRTFASGTVTGAGGYLLDRWRTAAGGQPFIYAQSGASMVITAPAGGIEQVIEDNNIEGGVYTLSWVGTATATVNGAAVTNGGQTAVLPAFTNVTVRFSNGTFSLPQFEKSVVATPFEYRHRAIELALCQRYYYRKNGATIWANGFAVGPSNATAFIQFPVTMRAFPTGGTNNISVFTTSGAFPAASYSIGNASNDSASLNIGFGGAVLTAREGLLVLGALPASFIDFNAEL